MSYRAVCAVALVVYAVAVLIGARSGHMTLVPLSSLDVPRGGAALLLAAGVLQRSRVIDLLAAAYMVWFGVWGIVAIAGGVALASELALVAAGIALRRAAAPSAQG